MNAVDARGVSAAASLFGGNENPGGPSSENMGKRHGSKIDFSLVSERGWPAALEGCAIMARQMSAHRSYNYHPAQTLLMAIGARAGFKMEWLAGADGTSLMEAYASGAREGSSHRHSEVLIALHALSAKFKVPGTNDRALCAALAILSSSGSTPLTAGQAATQLGTDYGQSRRVIAHVEPLIRASGERCEATVEFLRENKPLASAFAKTFPALWAHIEAAELAAIGSLASAPERKAPRL